MAHEIKPCEPSHMLGILSLTERAWALVFAQMQAPYRTSTAATQALPPRAPTTKRQASSAGRSRGISGN
jgi:hypothetical protein